MKEMQRGFSPVTTNSLSSWVATVKGMRTANFPLINYSSAGVGVGAAVSHTRANNIALVSCHAMNSEASGGAQGDDGRLGVHFE